MKRISVKEIKSAHTLSKSPLVVSVTHTDGSSMTSSLSQLESSYSEQAQKKIKEISNGHWSETLKRFVTVPEE